MNFDAEGEYLGEICPKCGSSKTITYTYDEGFSELECQSCGHTTESEELSALNRYRGELREGEKQPPPVPIKKLKA
jgi:Zn ribbon nucleic-acid-binding protein